MFRVALLMCIRWPMQIDLHREALKSCEDVLQKDPKNVKALFRAGKVSREGKGGGGDREGGRERERERTFIVFTFCRCYQ